MIELKNVQARMGRFELSPTTLTVKRGEQVILTGPTGCGKSTLLELIAGFAKPTAGRILLAGREVAGLNPSERGLGYVPQEPTLFRTMTVAENLGFALAARGRSKADIARRVGEIAEQLGLAELLSRSAAHLSGGEAQRTALGRALAFEPTILLLDEPFHAQDDDRRQQLRELVQSDRVARGTTILHVSHSLGDQTAEGVRKVRLRDCWKETS